MEDWIGRQETIKAIEQLNIPEDMCVFEILSHITLAIETLPSAQAERKKGRWLPVRGCDGGYWVCSSCKNPTEAFAANVLYKYCPFCGADMRKQKLQYGDEDTSQGGLMSAT